MGFFNLFRGDESNVVTFDRNGNVVKPRQRSYRHLDKLADLIESTDKKIGALDRSEKRMLAKKVLERGISAQFCELGVTRTREEISIRQPSLYKNVQANPVQTETEASKAHSKIVGMRMQTPPVTFRRIASELNLPLSSVQNEIIKHSKSRCECYMLKS